MKAFNKGKHGLFSCVSYDNIYVKVKLVLTTTT